MTKETENTIIKLVARRMQRKQEMYDTPVRKLLNCKLKDVLCTKGESALRMRITEFKALSEKFAQLGAAKRQRKSEEADALSLRISELTSERKKLIRQRLDTADTAETGDMIAKINKIDDEIRLATELIDAMKAPEQESLNPDQLKVADELREAGLKMAAAVNVFTKEAREIRETLMLLQVIGASYWDVIDALVVEWRVLQPDWYKYKELVAVAAAGEELEKKNMG